MTLRARIWLYTLRAAAVFGALLLLIVLLTGAAGVYTSRSEFCRSCHIMEPYYIPGRSRATATSRASSAISRPALAKKSAASCSAWSNWPSM